MTILVPVLIVAALVLANAVFVAAEFAIVGAPRAGIAHEAGQGRRLARAVARILDSPRLLDRYIATTQIGISVASLGLGMYGEHVLAGWIAGQIEPLDTGRWVATHTLASILAVSALTYLHIVVGEMVPKALALQRAQHTVLYVSPVIRALEMLLLPCVIALNAIGNGLLHLFGVQRSDTPLERYHTSEELQFIIQESQEGGLLRGESGRILRELFEFGDLTASQVMVPRVRLAGIARDATVDQMKDIVRAAPHTRYPVYARDLDDIVGSIHIKQLLRHFVANRPLGYHEARLVPHVPRTLPLDEVLAAMRRHRSQMAVVMDEHGGTAGIVTIEDLFEEVVGDIEEGRARLPVTRDTDGRLIVRGTVRLEEVGEILGVRADRPDVETVSGLVLTLLGRPPAVGDVVTWKDVRVEVTGVAGRGVADARVSRATGDP